MFEISRTNRSGETLKRIAIPATLLLLLITASLALMAGAVSISITDIVLHFFTPILNDETEKTVSNINFISAVLFDIRLPRVVLSIAVGAALGISGAAMQVCTYRACF